MNAIAPLSAPTASSNSLVPQNMDQAIRLAELMARSKLVPQHLQGSVGDCFMVVEQAGRWNMSPFAVGQCTSSIKGKLMFEGKLVQAAVENSGAIVGLIDYAYAGSGQDRTITVSATRRGETAPRTVEVRLKDAITENGIWKKQPDQQLAYHGARVWARRWTPGVILGVYSPEEMDLPVYREPPHSGPTLDGVAEPAPRPRDAVDADSIPAPKKPPADPARTYVDKLTEMLSVAPSLPEMDALLTDPARTKRFDELREKRPELAKEVDGAVDAARERLRPPPTNNLPPVDDADEFGGAFA